MPEPLTPAAILDLRTRLGLNQTAFAELLRHHVPGLGVDQVAVSRWEHGHVKPSGVATYVMQSLMAQSTSRSSPPE